MYFLYLLRCADDSLYCGITTDLARRVEEHNTSNKGAKYTRGRRPVVLVYSQRFRSRSAASRTEAKIKKMTRTEKEKLVHLNH